MAVGVADGLDRASVISCDEPLTVPAAHVGKLLGHLLEAQELELAEAIVVAFGLDV